MASSDLVDRFFLYGTLLPGECRRPFVERVGGVSLGQATASGWLIDLGDYPGFIDEEWLWAVEPNAHQPARKTVVGEVVKVQDLTQAFRVLDEEEGCSCADFGLSDLGQPARVVVALGQGLYVRRLQRIQTKTEGELWAWTYHYNHATFPIRWIQSGCWRTHRAQYSRQK